MVQVVSEKRSILVRFQYGCDKYMTSSQLTLMTVEKSPANKEPEVPMNAVIPDNTVDFDKG